MKVEGRLLAEGGEEGTNEAAEPRTMQRELERLSDLEAVDRT